MRFVPDELQRFAPGKERCVWMEAGLLSYVLCDREFDCDNCPLDAAMRSHYSADLAGTARRASAAAASDRRAASAEVRYTRNHFRVERLPGAMCRVGFEPEFGKVIESLKSIVLPEAGQTLSPETCCAWVIMEAGTLPLKFALGGTVTAVNPLIAEQPHLACFSSPDRGWLFELELAEPERWPQLMEREAALGCYESDRGSFRRSLLAELRGHPEVGITLPDGGEFSPGVYRLLGPRRYCSIVRSTYLRSAPVVRKSEKP